MAARFAAYPNDSAALVRILDEDTSYRIGRSSECEIRIEHRSISRFHAELSGSAQRWSLNDTGSKNGLSIDGRLTRRAELDKSTWFMIGDVYCSFEPLDAEASAALRANGETRRATSRAMSAQLQPNLGVGTLIPQTLDMVLQLSGLERGFVLYAPRGEPLRVRATRGLRAEEIASRQFAGSIAAVDRALASGEHVVCCDTNDSPWLCARPSVRLGGIRSLICVPLTLGEHATGVLYADSRKPGPPITELDIELVENVTRQASAAIEAARLETRIIDAMRNAAEIGVPGVTPSWEELRRIA